MELGNNFAGLSKGHIKQDHMDKWTLQYCGYYNHMVIILNMTARNYGENIYIYNNMADLLFIKINSRVLFYDYKN